MLEYLFKLSQTSTVSSTCREVTGPWTNILLVVEGFGTALSGYRAVFFLQPLPQYLTVILSSSSFHEVFYFSYLEGTSKALLMLRSATALIFGSLKIPGSSLAELVY